MLRTLLLTLVTVFAAHSIVFAQMWNGTDTLYGNEWIDYNQSYYKVLVAEDGIYRLSKSALESAGFDANDLGDLTGLFSFSGN